jgi:flagellar motor switch protein FliN
VSPENIPEIGAADREYARVWAESAASVLEKLHGTAFIATVQPVADAKEGGTSEGDSLWINFKASGKLAGEQAFQISSSDGVRLAQLLMSESMDGAVEQNEGHTDALNELFRQFAGLVATACKTKYGDAVEFELESALKPSWQAASQTPWIFAAPQLTPLRWKMLVSAELHATLLAAEDRKPQNRVSEAVQELSKQAATPGAAARAPLRSPTPQAPASAPAAVSADAGNTSNLDLLLEVELDASLRFGQREMLLREILELRPGSVVELNRQLQEPAELLVGGRVIARGEVVIVDGNYGLRITDIIQPQKRLKSLHT